MKLKHVMLVALALGWASCVVMPMQAAAEAAAQEARPIDTIVVVAPRIRQEADRVGTSRVTTISRDIRVSFADLDLTRTGDLYLLEARVQEAAQDVCEELAEMFPDAQPSVSVCIRRATEDAMVQVRDAARRALDA